MKNYHIDVNPPILFFVLARPFFAAFLAPFLAAAFFAPFLDAAFLTAFFSAVFLTPFLDAPFFALRLNVLIVPAYRESNELYSTFLKIALSVLAINVVRVRIYNIGALGSDPRIGSNHKHRFAALWRFLRKVREGTYQAIHPPLSGRLLRFVS